MSNLVLLNMRLLSGILLFIVGSGPVLAVESRYMASMEESEWDLTRNSPIECRIEHYIPHFGKASFTREAGRSLQLQIDTVLQVKKGIAVEFRSESALWRPSETVATLANLTTTGSSSLFDIPPEVAERAYFELREGFHPGFIFNRDNALRASMSTVNFRRIENAFRQCQEQLHDQNFDDIRLTRVHFDNDDEFPKLDEERVALQPMLDYLQVDDSIREIVVSGHADMNGKACYNDDLSQRRALYVYDLLLAKGIDPEMITVDFYGESRPLRKGKDKQALAANRRVTIELRR